MMDEKMALENLRRIAKEAHEKGQTGLLIWKSPEEREKWGGSEENMWVKDAFEVHGYAQDGSAYGDYRTMELTRAIRNAFECEYQFKLVSMDGKSVGAMAFEIDKLLSIEGHLMFACRGMVFGFLNGPIVSIPSYQVVE